MCWASEPPEQDYEGAAEKTSEGNLDLAQYATQANRPDQYTPWGSSTWEQSEGVIDQAAYDKAMRDFEAYRATVKKPENLKAPDIEDFRAQGKWTQRTTLTPELQAILDKNVGLQSTLADLGIQTGEYLKDMTSQPLDFGDFEGARSGVMDAMLSRVNQQISQDREQKAAQLAARGIPQGSEAWNREMTSLDQRLTDARQQAEIAATNMALNERQRLIQETMLERQTPLNELAAFRSGSQVQMPQFQPFAQQATTAGPDYLGAAQAQGAWDMNMYNADVAQQNAILQALFGLGSASLMPTPKAPV